MIPAHDGPDTDSAAQEQHSVGEVILAFLLLGTVAFGGPAAHVALMRRFLVERFQWIGEAEFFELFGACNLIPGPSSTELAILLGYKRAGRMGLLLGGACFILPAMVIMIGLAALYHRFGGTMPARRLLTGVTAVVVGILAWAVLDVASRVLRGPGTFVLCLALLIAALLGVSPIVVLITGGLLLGLPAFLSHRRRRDEGVPASKHVLLILGFTLEVSGKLVILTWTFLKIGFIAFGSGYVLLVLLRSELVVNLHWLTDRQVVDAVAISQATPGPVFTTATFIGYLVGGVPGSVLATVAIFAPAFLFVPPWKESFDSCASGRRCEKFWQASTSPRLD